MWQANEDGFYDVQQPGVLPERPVGQLLQATGRHPNRPAHMHFIVTAPGHRAVITHLFVEDSPYIDSDAVFGVKDSLVRAFPTVDYPARARELGLPNPFRSVHFDLRLLREDAARRS